MTAEQFRDARVFGGLTREQAAELVGVSLRTIGHWETGRCRPTWSAFKLLRMYRHGELVHPAWSGYRIVRGKLVTPEEHSFAPSDLAWLSLLVRRSHAFSELRRRQEALSRDAGQGDAPAARAASWPRVDGVRPGQPLAGCYLAVAASEASQRPQGPSRNAATAPGGTFSPLRAVERDDDRAGCPVGPISNTGQKPAQLGPEVRR